jgi:hypothetical protein
MDRSDDATLRIACMLVYTAAMCCGIAIESMCSLSVAQHCCVKWPLCLLQRGWVDSRYLCERW